MGTDEEAVPEGRVNGRCGSTCAARRYDALGVGSEVRTLPIDLIRPPRLASTYQTRPAFVPRTTFTVGEGWTALRRLMRSGPCVSRPYCDKLRQQSSPRYVTENPAGEPLIRSRTAFAFALRTRRTWSDRHLEEPRVRNASLDSCSARRSLPWERMKRLFQRVALTVGVAVLALLAVTTALGVGSEVRTLPIDLIRPPRLEPGTYQTRPAFVPRTTFTVGKGWDGAQETHSAWCVGKGSYPTPASFREALGPIRICVVRLGPPYSTAISRFEALTTLTAGASKPIRVGGYPGVSFRAAVHGDHSLLPGIAPLIDLLPGGEQIFLNVRGKAVLLLIEISPGTPGEGAVRGFLRTMRFPA